MNGTDASNPNCGISLVLPAYNEVECILVAIRTAQRSLAELAEQHEIIVVNDGSRDATGEVVRREMANSPGVRLIEHPRNRGYGAAMRSGLAAARYPLVAFTDADLQFDLAELAHMIPLAAEYDIVCGYRINRQDPAYRRLLSRGYNTLITVLLGSQVRDCDCALKLFRGEAVRRVLPESENYFANTEILWKARQHGLSVVEVGVHHRPRRMGHSKISLADVPRTLATLLPFWWTNGRGRKAESEGQRVRSLVPYTSLSTLRSPPPYDVLEAEN